MKFTFFINIDCLGNDVRLYKLVAGTDLRCLPGMFENTENELSFIPCLP